MDSDSISKGALSTTRTLSLTPFGAAEADRIRETLEAFSGVGAVMTAPESGRVRVTYDLAKVRLVELEEALRAAGFAPAGGWWPRLKRAWTGFVEENVGGSDYAGGSCCGTPPDEEGSGRDSK